MMTSVSSSSHSAVVPSATAVVAPVETSTTWIVPHQGVQDASEALIE